MFDYLTKYLLQYKRVSIPSVGTIQLVQQPAQLNVADKLILPPSYNAEFRNEDHVPDHQLNFLASLLNKERENIHQSLCEFGHRLKERMNGEGFEWKGIGVIHTSNEGSTVFPGEGLEPVVAEKVIRQDAEHRVLVGDQQMTSTQIAGLREEVVENKRSVLIIIGWIVLAMSILYIIFILWQGKFRVGAVGSKSSPTSFIKVSDLRTY